jgi:hypothetical protein
VGPYFEHTWIKTKLFARFARKERIEDSALREAVDRAMRGLIDADLGGVLKQRVARKGQGRSGGFRVLLAMRAKDRTVFVYGFAKNDRANINDDELADLRDVAASWMAADAKKIERALAEGLLMEVPDES